MNSMKKYFLYLIGAFCSLLAPLLLVFIAQPFFHIEGDMSHGTLNDYGQPGNLICIVIIPSILIAVCLFFSYFLLIHKKRMNNINIVLSLVVSIIFTFSISFGILYGYFGIAQLYDSYNCRLSCCCI